MPNVTVEKSITLDLLPDTKPGTSATSDMPVIETHPDSVPKPQPEKAEHKDVTATPTESPSAEPEAKKPQGVQKRLDELTRNWREEQRSRQASEELLKKALGLLEQSKAPAKAEVSTDDPEPAEPDETKYTDQKAYNADFRKYLVEQARWAGRQEFKQLQKRDSDERSKRSQEENRKKLALAYQANVVKAREKYTDYDEVVGDESLPITAPMADAIAEAGELGPEIAYHLGTNREEALRISQLSPRGQFLELGKLAFKLGNPAKPPVPPVSQAPKPITPIKSGATAATSSDEESMEAYAARRAKQLQEERRPGRR